MAVKTITELKAYFVTGAIPTEAQYIDLMDTIFAPIVYLGPFKNDAAADTGGVAIGEAYKLTLDNDYGIPSNDNSTLKVRAV